MEEVLKVVVLGRACRNTANIKNRQPIGTMYVKAPEKMDTFFTDIIADELNVKEVKFTDDVESFISYSFQATAAYGWTEIRQASGRYP